MGIEFMKIKLNEMIRNGRLLESDRKILLRNLEELQKIMNQQKVPYGSKEYDERLCDACKFIVKTGTYNFKTAFADFGAKSEEDFLTKEWCSEVCVVEGKRSLKMKLCDLYNACSSVGYLDANTGLTAKALLDGKCTNESFDALKAALDLDDAEYVCEDDELVKSDSVNELFKMIKSADDIRSLQFGNDLVSGEAEKILNTIYTYLDKHVFYGETKCVVNSSISDEEDVKRVVDVLGKHEFDTVYEITDDSTELIVSCVQHDGDYDENYSEEELSKLLETHRGSVYHFVAVYCKCVLEPKILEKAVMSTVEALGKVTVSDDEVCIEKLSTKTCVYKKLYKVLGEKGFKVCDENDRFVLRW